MITAVLLERDEHRHHRGIIHLQIQAERIVERIEQVRRQIDLHFPGPGKYRIRLSRRHVFPVEKPRDLCADALLQRRQLVLGEVEQADGAVRKGLGLRLERCPVHCKRSEQALLLRQVKRRRKLRAAVRGAIAYRKQVDLLGTVIH